MSEKEKCKHTFSLRKLSHYCLLSPAQPHSPLLYLLSWWLKHVVKMFNQHLALGFQYLEISREVLPVETFIELSLNLAF